MRRSGRACRIGLWSLGGPAATCIATSAGRARRSDYRRLPCRNEPPTNVFIEPPRSGPVRPMELKMKLYEFAPTRSIRARWTLQELGVDFEPVTVDLVAGEHRRPEF